MDIQAIKTEQDYDRALSQIEELQGIDEGTEDGDEFDDNEQIHYPIPLP